MEVDHINPTLRHPFRNRHGNLIASSRHCNGAKSNTWYKEDDRKAGFYVINPYEEEDYGKHIVENQKTGVLVGRTITGKWHIEILDLNADHLIMKRLDRTMLHGQFLKAAMASGADPSNVMFDKVLRALSVAKKALLDRMIPMLPKL